MAGLKVTQREYTGRGCEVTHFLFTNGHFSMQNTQVSIDILLVRVLKRFVREVCVQSGGKCLACP